MSRFLVNNFCKYCSNFERKTNGFDEMMMLMKITSIYVNQNAEFLWLPSILLAALFIYFCLCGY